MSEQDLDPQVPGETTTENPPPENDPKDQVPEQKPAKADMKGKPGPKPGPKPQGLPDASTIDPKKITRAVLTKQGWVCPEKSPNADKVMR